MPSQQPRKDSTAMASSQSMTQTDKAVANMDRAEMDRRVNDVVKYLLIMDQKKVPIKKLDISKNVLKEHAKAFPAVIKEAAKKLDSVFGIELKELEDNKHNSFILVNNLDTDAEQPHMQWSDEDDQKTGLTMIILALIFMSGNVLQDNHLYHALKKFGIDIDEPHEVFGDVKKFLTQELVRQCYLEITRQPNTDPPVFEFKWGQRAFLETSKRSVLNFVSQIYDMEPQLWISQWHDVKVSEGGEMEEPSTS